MIHPLGPDGSIDHHGRESQILDAGNFFGGSLRILEGDDADPFQPVRSFRANFRQPGVVSVTDSIGQGPVLPHVYMEEKARIDNLNVDFLFVEVSQTFLDVEKGLASRRSAALRLNFSSGWGSRSWI